MTASRSSIPQHPLVYESVLDLIGGTPLVKIDDFGADRRRSPATTELQSVISSKTNEDFEAT